jgi:uncharacterized protein DUF6950
VVADLPAFLERTAARPFSWGDHDCLLLLCDWIALKHGADAGARWRGTYHTRLGANRILKRWGGAVMLLDQAFGPLGLRRTEEPQAGDVGVVRGMGAKAPADFGAIFTGARWAGLALGGGLLAGKAEPIAAWRV